MAILLRGNDSEDDGENGNVRELNKDWRKRISSTSSQVFQYLYRSTQILAKKYWPVNWCSKER